jgi:hypothetical protein
MSMTPEEVRLECLKLVQQSANASGLLIEPNQIISRARAYADFVMDWHGQGTVRGINGKENPEMRPGEFRKPRPVAPTTVAIPLL